MAGELKLLLIALDPMEAPELPAFLERGATPYLAELHPVALSGVVAPARSAEEFWPALLSEPLARPGMRAGLVNLPWPGPAPETGGFFIGRDMSVTPPGLAHDLADYLPDPRPPRAGKTTGGRADLAYAEQAAVTRIRFEHTRRLVREWGLELAVVDLGGLGLTRDLFGAASGRWLVYLRQIDYYTRRLVEDTSPRAWGLVSPQGLLELRDPAHPRGRELGPVDISRAAGIITRLVDTEAAAP